MTSQNNCETINCEFVAKLSPGLQKEMLNNHVDFDYVTCCPEVFNINKNNMNYNKDSESSTVTVNNYGDNYYYTYNYYGGNSPTTSNDDGVNNPIADNNAVATVFDSL